MKKSRSFKQGVFRPRFPDKYKGTFPILYRSSYEKRFMVWCDSNPHIIQWGSESIVIPYQNPLTGRVSRYFVDNNITVKESNGTVKKYLIEIKPSIQTQPPKQTRNTKALFRRQLEYVKNRAKWKAAQEWSEKKGYKFYIITEKQLGI